MVIIRGSGAKDAHPGSVKQQLSHFREEGRGGRLARRSRPRELGVWCCHRDNGRRSIAIQGRQRHPSPGWPPAGRTRAEKNGCIGVCVCVPACLGVWVAERGPQLQHQVHSQVHSSSCQLQFHTHMLRLFSSVEVVSARRRDPRRSMHTPTAVAAGG